MASLTDDLRNYLAVSAGNNNISGQKSSWFSFNGVRSPTWDSVWLLNSETGEEDAVGGERNDWLPSLSRKQRIIGFFICLLVGAFCIGLASLYLPFLLLKARKFALLYSMGSLFLVCSFGLLWGPLNHVRHLLTAERLPFTLAYFGTMFGTLYFSMAVRSTPLTVICALAQVCALVWYMVSYIPGGQTGLKFFSRMFSAAVSRSVAKSMPV